MHILSFTRAYKEVPIVSSTRAEKSRLQSHITQCRSCHEPVTTSARSYQKFKLKRISSDLPMIQSEKSHPVTPASNS